MNQKIKYLVLIFFTLNLEFLRDYIFININLQIDFLLSKIDHLVPFNYTDSSIYLIIKNMSIQTLKVCKWILSISFALLYFVIGYIVSMWTFKKKNHDVFIKLFSIGGFSIILISFLIFITGKLLNLENQMNFYFISLELSHFVQSSLYPMSFLLVFFAYNRTKISL